MSCPARASSLEIFFENLMLEFFVQNHSITLKPTKMIQLWSLSKTRDNQKLLFTLERVTSTSYCRSFRITYYAKRFKSICGSPGVTSSNSPETEIEIQYQIKNPVLESSCFCIKLFRNAFHANTSALTQIFYKERKNANTLTHLQIYYLRKNRLKVTVASSVHVESTPHQTGL